MAVDKEANSLSRVYSYYSLKKHQHNSPLLNNIFKNGNIINLLSNYFQYMLGGSHASDGICHLNGASMS